MKLESLTVAHLRQLAREHNIYLPSRLRKLEIIEELKRHSISSLPVMTTESPKAQSPKVVSPKAQSPKVVSPKAVSPKAVSTKTRDPYENLPDEVILYELMPRMDYETLSKFCQTNRRFSNLCETEYIQKLRRNKFAEGPDFIWRVIDHIRTQIGYREDQYNKHNELVEQYLDRFTNEELLDLNEQYRFWLDKLENSINDFGGEYNDGYRAFNKLMRDEDLSAGEQRSLKTYYQLLNKYKNKAFMRNEAYPLEWTRNAFENYIPGMMILGKDTVTKVIEDPSLFLVNKVPLREGDTPQYLFDEDEDPADYNFDESLAAWEEQWPAIEGFLQYPLNDLLEKRGIN